jgi:uncharacterized protein YjgD (DUF1641 family)
MRNAALTAPPTDAAEVRLAALEQKLDSLTKSVDKLGQHLQLLTDKALDDRRRQREWDELRADMTPIVQDMYTVTVNQLEEIQSYVQLEDVLHLLKRLARNTRNFNELLDQLESLQDLWRDLGPLTNDMFAQAVMLLDNMDRKGYFGFVRQGQYVMDQIVTSFDEEDVRLLGDNIVIILNTIKALTQPQMMTLANNLTQGFQEVDAHADELPTSFLALARQMRDPDVRRGLAVTMALLKRISQQHPAGGVATAPATTTNGNGHH